MTPISEWLIGGSCPLLVDAVNRADGALAGRHYRRRPLRPRLRPVPVRGRPVPPEPLRRRLRRLGF